MSLYKIVENLLGISSSLKGSIFLKNRHFIIQERFNKLIYGIRHFIIQERFNKLIYGINTIIKCGTCVNLLNLSWIEKMSIFEEYGALNNYLL